jgi:MoaA/NifB/PqqE/SkfB family radical SAM enzyme
MYTILRQTKSLCPICLNEIKAYVVVHDDKVYLEKYCSEHGKVEVQLSNESKDYEDLHDFFFSLNKRKITKEYALPQSRYTLRFTWRCNMKCKICCASGNIKKEEPPLTFIANILKNINNCLIEIYGGEPTMRDDLPDLIKLIAKLGNTSALYTNGIKIGEDFNYLKILKESGLQLVKLQFDGFCDSIYQDLREEKILDTKLKALKNLDILNIHTDIICTVVKNKNEDQILKIIKYGLGHSFIKFVSIIGYRYIGRTGYPYDFTLTPEDLIDALQKLTNAKITRMDFYLFQKLKYIFEYLSLMPRTCFYHRSLPIYRRRNDLFPMSQIFKLDSLEKRFNKFKDLIKNDKNIKARLYFILRILPALFIKGRYNVIPLVKFVYKNKIEKKTNYKALPENLFILSLGTLCDPYNIDFDNGKFCGKGHISVEDGIYRSTMQNVGYR